MIPEKERPTLKNINLKLRSANGEILKVHGETIVDIMIGNQKFKFPVKVVSLGDKNAILGLDFMSANDCVLYLSKGVLQIGSRSLRFNLHKQSDSRCARIQAYECIEIPAKHEVIIAGKINKVNRTLKVQ